MFFFSFLGGGGGISQKLMVSDKTIHKAFRIHITL